MNVGDRRGKTEIVVIFSNGDYQITCTCGTIEKHRKDRLQTESCRDCKKRARGMAVKSEAVVRSYTVEEKQMIKEFR